MRQRGLDALVDLVRPVFAVGQAHEPLKYNVQRAVLRDDKVPVAQRIRRQIRAVAVHDGVHIRPRPVDGLVQQILARPLPAPADLRAAFVHDADILPLKQQLHPAGRCDIRQSGFPVYDGGVALQRGHEALLLQNVCEKCKLLCVIHCSVS